MKLLLFCLFFESILSAPLIPQIVWSYVPNAHEMTVLEALCIDNIRRYSLQSGHTFTLLTNDNYTNLLQKWEEVSPLLDSSQLERQVTLKTLIQLKILSKLGGIWIDSNSMLVESLDWMTTIKNQKHINNRVDDPEVVMFYEPGWFDSTEKKKGLKEEELVVVPWYQAWFMAVPRGSQFIKDVQQLFIDTIVLSYDKTEQIMKDKGIEVADYLMEERLFFPWIIRTVVEQKQKQLDYEKMSPRRLAITEYLISAIDATNTADLVIQEARGHIHLTTKLLAEVSSHQLNSTTLYGLRLGEAVARQLRQTVEVDYVGLQHYHSAGDMLCDGEAIPLRFVVKDSIIDKHLLSNTSVNFTVKVYEEQFVRHHCEGSFIEVYVVFGEWLLLAALCIGHIILVRKALLYFKPEWGSRRRVVEFVESDL